MRFIRRFLLCLTLALALVAILAIAAFVPRVQTLVAQMMLPDQPGRQASLGSLSAGFSGVDVTDLHLNFDGAVLTLPSLSAKLPLKTAVWDRKMVIRNLVAKGWTLDLSRRPAPADAEARAPGVAARDGERGVLAPAVAVPAQQVAHVFRGILSDWKLPYDGSLDGVDLEGDVLLAVASEPEPVKVHVILKGGGLTADHEGDFAVEATGAVADPTLPFHAAAARGHLKVAMGNSRTISRVEFKASLSAEGGSLPADLTLSAGVASAGGPGKETYSVDLSRGTRHLATVLAGYPNAARRFEGTWKVDLRDSDLTPLFPEHPFPAVAAAGEGRFDADTAFAQMHAVGRLYAATGRLGVLVPALGRLGDVTLDSGFDLTRSGRSIQFDRLSVALTGPRPIAVVKSLQPFSLDQRTGGVKLTTPSADWLEGSLQGLPLAWFSGLTGEFALAGNDATGEFVVRATDDGFALLPKTPLTATGVSVQRADRMLAQGLDLSLALLVDHTPQGWQVQWAPMTVSSAGQRLASIEAKASRPEKSDGKVEISGTWTADLAALAARPVIPEVGGLKGLSASGDFSARLGSTTEVNGKLNVIGHDPGHSVTASAHAYVGAHGTASFRIPVRIALGSKVAEFTAEGRYSDEKIGTRLDVDLSGVKVALEPFGLLAGSLPALGGVSWPATLAAAAGGTPTPAGERDQRPFWGDWIGRVTVDFYQLGLGTHELDEVAGAFEIDHGAIRLAGGRGKLADNNPPMVDRPRSRTRADASSNQAKAEGSLTFDATAEFPYSVKATATLGTVDAARLFAAPKSEQDPMIEGHFSVAGTLTGNGINLTDLIGRRQEEYRLASTAGIIRFLKTNVAESITEDPSKVPGALVAVSSAVGALLGVKGHSLYSGQNKLSKNTEAVLNFTSQVAEIGYDQATITAVRGADQTIRLVDLTMSGPSESLTGSGQIAYVKNLPLAARPLSLDLRLGARGGVAELLSTAGLLAVGKDSQGYSWLNQTIHFGGTLEQIDESQWHDLLVKAATPVPEGPKKGG